MRYRLKDGVVLFKMCDGHFIFPSREAGDLLPVLLTASDELVSVLQQDSIVTDDGLSLETKKKLKRLVNTGFIEECCK